MSDNPDPASLDRLNINWEYVGRGIRALFILFWNGLWLYLSLAMVIASFSAIQLQTKIIDQAVKGDAPSVAQIVVHYERYQHDLTTLANVNLIQKQQAEVLKPGDDSSRSSLSSLTSILYTEFFGSNDKFPNNPLIAISEKCHNESLSAQTRAACAEFSRKTSVTDHKEESFANDETNGTSRNDNLAIRTRIEKYESLPEYGIGADLNFHRMLTRFLLPWLPNDLLLSTLPHPTLVLIVTVSMGALGSVIFMLQLILLPVGDAAGKDRSASFLWYIFRPFQGMTVALAIYLLVKAGQIAVSHSSNVEEADLNPFVLGFLGIVSGLLSDKAIERLTAAGVELFRKGG